jgi:hypothetical protein
MELVETEKIFCNVNPFYIQKDMKSIAGNVKNAYRLRNDTLLGGSL